MSGTSTPRAGLLSCDFADTFERLELRFTSDCRPFNRIDEFPRLRSLVLDGDLDGLTTVLYSCSNSPLEILDLQLRNYIHQLTPDLPLLSTLSSLRPTLRNLICTPRSIRALPHTSSVTLHAFCTPTNIALSTRGEYSAFLITTHYSTRVDGRAIQTSEVCQSIRRALVFGWDRTVAMERTGDLEGANVLLDKTRSLWSLQELWRD